MHWFHHWLTPCTLGLCIVTLHWCRNSGFLTIFTSAKRIRVDTGKINRIENLVSFFIITFYRQTDRHTDRQTNRHVGYAPGSRHSWRCVWRVCTSRTPCSSWSWRAGTAWNSTRCRTPSSASASSGWTAWVPPSDTTRRWCTSNRKWWWYRNRKCRETERCCHLWNSEI